MSEGERGYNVSYVLPDAVAGRLIHVRTPQDLLPLLSDQRRKLTAIMEGYCPGFARTLAAGLEAVEKARGSLLLELGNSDGVIDLGDETIRERYIDGIVNAYGRGMRDELDGNSSEKGVGKTTIIPFRRRIKH